MSNDPHPRAYYIAHGLVEKLEAVTQKQQTARYATTGKALAAVLLSVVISAQQVAVPVLSPAKEKPGSMRAVSDKVSLPAAKTAGGLPLDTALAKRRSVRDFTSEPLTHAMLSQLLWSMQGITNSEGNRTAPSAGALYPLETYVVSGDGLYHYEPARHELTKKSAADERKSLCRAAWEQESVGQAAAVFVIAAVYERTSVKYGAARGERYVLLESGHAAQNLLLQAVSLGLGAVPIGAFNDTAVATVLQLPKNEKPIYLLPVGHQR